MKTFTMTLAVIAVTVAASSASYGAGFFTVPEIDPAMGTGALALLGGAIMVIRGRRK